MAVWALVAVVGAFCVPALFDSLQKEREPFLLPTVQI